MEAGEVLSHYRLMERIGEGGMGVVWKALDTTLGRTVAIKVLSDGVTALSTSLARLEHEAKTLAALNHPAIVTVYSVESADGVHFLTMEWLQGRTLKELIPPEGMPFSRFLEMALPVVEGIIAAHEHGIAHRDIKPRNVMLTDSGRIKVLDFGLARQTAEGPDPAGTAPTVSLETVPGLVGTLSYMSPEQLRGQPCDQRSDIFSLGVLFYEMLTGRMPFDGANAPDLSASILRDEPPSVTLVRPDLPVHLGWLIARCLEKDPAGRFETARELHAELDVLHRARRAAADAEGSIAVLPFSDMSQQKDQEYFCDGIAEEITNALTKVRNLHVVPRTSAFQFRNATLALREIGRRLGAKTLLTGSVRKAGDQLRITVTLTDVEDGYSLWSERFDREMKDVFAIQDEIADNVVRALSLSLSPRERRAIRNVATDVAEAYEFYLRGRRMYYQHSRRGLEFARKMFDQAITLDPSYALAHAGLADCMSLIYLYVDDSEPNRERALEESRTALSLDPELAQAHVSHGIACGLFDRHEESVASFERALELEPRLYEADFFFAREVFMHGDREKAARLFERGFEARPEDYQIAALLGQVYEDLGRAADARVMRRRAISNAEEHLKVNPDDVRAYYMSANAMVALGEVERGLERTRLALRLEPADCMVLYNAGCIFAITGRLEEALECLEKSVQVGNIQFRYFQHDSNLDPLRDLPGFQALMRVLEERLRKRAVAAGKGRPDPDRTGNSP
jgi:serine/threonine protein kinase/Tfp pilus assembly protein PilF